MTSKTTELKTAPPAPADDEATARRRFAWTLSLAVFLPFAFAAIAVLTQPVHPTKIEPSAYADLLSGKQPAPKLMRRLDTQAVPVIPYARIVSRSIATVAAVIIAIAAGIQLGRNWRDQVSAREFAESIADGRQPVIRIVARYMMEVVLIAFSFFFALLTLLFVFFLTQVPSGATATVLDRVAFHAQGDILYYVTFQYGEVMAFAAGIFGLACYRRAGMGSTKTIIAVAAISMVLLAFNKAAYFAVPLCGYVFETMRITRQAPGS